LDTLLGLFTGVLAYHLWEIHPRTAMPEDQRLVQLLRWKWAKRLHESEKAAELKDKEAAQSE
jgi:hypothetical protein